VDTLNRGVDHNVGLHLSRPAGPTLPSAEARWRVAATSLEHSGYGVEGVNSAGEEAKIADQQVTAELTETVRSQGDACQRA
jgi:hypothetical protein